MGEWLDWVILWVFSNLGDSMILWFQEVQLDIHFFEIQHSWYWVEASGLWYNMVAFFCLEFLKKLICPQ